MRQIVVPTTRRTRPNAGMPPVITAPVRPVIQTAARDQFGAIVLRQVGGQR